ncbi:kinase-like domain-containing protein [Massariosphaeria phaeospora]|uniref:Kinase-like domain-containing protein n=1 Tax=Massariosphaeria phaeospora TaxID=100035 RepID=A0A7C8MZ85_9PLEO|nr:kinase-like domain-containing protein [Massariosphaeria phaeospora]
MTRYRVSPMVYDHTDIASVRPDLIHIPQGKNFNPDFKDKEKLEGITCEHIRQTVELCRACGWNTDHELGGTYIPRVRVAHTTCGAGMWQIGSEWLLWDRINDGRRNNDFMTHKFLRSHNVQNIPLVKEMQSLSAPTDKVQFTLMSRAKGVPLADIWHTLDRKQRQGYMRQMDAALREMRQFTAPFPQKVDGTPLHDRLVADCEKRASDHCKTIGKTTEEWFNNIADELRYGLSIHLNTKDAAVIEEKFQQLRARFPEPGTCVLTHGDLHFHNIIVDPDSHKIEAIIDWEYAGFYPEWAERLLAAKWGHHPLLDHVWKKLFPEVDAAAFWTTVEQPVEEVQDIWRLCPIEHTEESDIWRSRGFCECKPYGGKIYQRFLGANSQSVQQPLVYMFFYVRIILLHYGTVRNSEPASDWSILRSQSKGVFYSLIVIWRTVQYLPAEFLERDLVDVVPSPVLYLFIDSVLDRASELVVCIMDDDCISRITSNAHCNSLFLAKYLHAFLKQMSSESGVGFGVVIICSWTEGI